ncbi:MAG: hypothetical protein Q7I97_07355 [Thermovirgaceae bacterium]|nr:hypothetical protein [Thermovirgaceae bacterium]
MSDSKDRSLRSEREKLLGELSGLYGLIHGSYFERYSTCSRPGCACHQGKKHGPRAYVSRTLEGKPRQHYVPKGQVDAVRNGIGQYHRMLQIADRITEINLELMREGRLDEP